MWNITGGDDLTLHEVNEAAEVIYDLVDPSALIIFGAVVKDGNSATDGEVSITLIATGFSPSAVWTIAPAARQVNGNGDSNGRQPIMGWKQEATNGANGRNGSAPTAEEPVSTSGGIPSFAPQNGTLITVLAHQVFLYTNVEILLSMSKSNSLNQIPTLLHEPQRESKSSEFTSESVMSRAKIRDASIELPPQTHRSPQTSSFANSIVRANESSTRQSRGRTEERQSRGLRSRNIEASEPPESYSKRLKPM